VVLPRCHPPLPCEKRVHPLMGCTPSSEYVLIVTCPTRAPNTSQGFLPIRDTSIWSQPGDELPTLTFVAPSTFLTSSTLCSSAYRVGLFHPTATSGIRTSGVFLAAKPARLIDESCPHIVDESFLPVSCPTGARSSRLAYRALIRAAIRCSRQAV
jgi:hypothetical protein